MNNKEEVVKNYYKWYEELKNEENFENIRNEFFQRHKKPKRFQIEVSTKCNFNCFMCPIDELKEHKLMSFETFKDIINKLPHSVDTVCLSGLGEPFLNKELINMAKYAKEKGLFVEIYNNGSLFDEKILNYVDLLVFSVDSPDETILKKLRKGVNPSRLFENIKKAISINKTTVAVNFTVNSLNYRQIKRLYDLCEVLGVDKLFIQGTNNNYSPESPSYVNFKRKLKEISEVNWKYIVDAYTDKYSFELTIWYPRKLKGFCSWGFSNFYVNVDGKVITCCQRVTNPLVFGDLTEEIFETIYNNMEFFRRAHKQNLELKICDTCPW